MWLSRRSMLPWALALAPVFAPACADEEDPDARSEDELRALVDPARRTAVWSAAIPRSTR